MLDPASGEPLLTGGYILGEIELTYAVSAGDLASPRRFAELVEARREAAHRLYWETHLTITEIGRILRRDRSTVHYYIWGKA